MYFLFKWPLCHRVKEFAVSDSLSDLPVSDLCKLPGVQIVSFNTNAIMCRIRGQKVSLPTFLQCDSRFIWGFFQLIWHSDTVFSSIQPSLLSFMQNKTYLQNPPPKYCRGLRLCNNLGDKSDTLVYNGHKAVTTIPILNPKNYFCSPVNHLSDVP